MKSVIVSAVLLFFLFIAHGMYINRVLYDTKCMRRYVIVEVKYFYYYLNKLSVINSFCLTCFVYLAIAKGESVATSHEKPIKGLGMYVTTPCNATLLMKNK